MQHNIEINTTHMSTMDFCTDAYMPLRSESPFGATKGVVKVEHGILIKQTAVSVRFWPRSALHHFFFLVCGESDHGISREMLI